LKTACKLRAAVSEPAHEQHDLSRDPPSAEASGDPRSAQASGEPRSARESRDPRSLRELQRHLKRWAFALVPAIGLVELGAHAVQVRSVAREADWTAAREFVASQAKPEDLVTFAPRWVDPIGRERFGPQLATIEREAPADVTQYPRAFEVSVRGAHVADLARWRRSDKRRFGDVTVTTLENPEPRHVLDDLVSLVNPQRLRVWRGDSECSFGRASPQSGGLGFGPGVPADRFGCAGGGFVAVSVVADLDYWPHRCIYAPPPGGTPLRLRFQDVHLGHTLRGHHALYVEAERGRTGAPVTLTFRVGDSVVGTVVHRDGDGWKPFEFDTSDRAGSVVELVAEIGAASGDRRMYCFQADTQ
jgi:hypothetical protein